ncbi:protein XRI1-like isoform X4 [Canna indica]|uniref:Protein XRI1-like isoform X4 n=1 Tax=Canna indica TaxID=4628 RepID=A0AAQ3KNC0_9LILI|nr:protein XRI1-like isoform X4 [Canna indica]
MRDSDMWEWEQEDYGVPRDSQLGLPQFLCNDNNQKDESLLYMVGNQTPIRDCGEFGLYMSEIADKDKMGLEEQKETSRVKRRRVLQFTSDADGVSADNEQLSSAVISSKDDSTVGDVYPENLQWNSNWSSVDRFLFSNEVLDHSSDEWLDSYFNDNEIRSLNKNDQVKPNDQVDVSDFCNEEPAARTNALPTPSKSATLRIFKGRKSYINSPTKLTTSVAYPFTLVKPCQVQGHLTLKDINQRIRAPSPSRLRNQIDDDPSINYPTSAFSGKPVVVKTKILTEGGKGSITILRTKG